MKEEYEYELLLDEEDRPILADDECKNVNSIIIDFMKCYAENSEQPVKTWLVPKMQEYFPDKKMEEIESIVDEIIVTVEVDEEKKNSLQEAIRNGRSKESWFASEIKKATAAMSNHEIANYLNDIDVAVRKANEALYRTITTKYGVVSQNPRLDGFIAEQYHAQTFNMNAKVADSQYRAKVLEPNGKGYAKNSVDIVIVDGNDKVVRRYQSKYCKDAKATERAFEHGNYRGQQKLVPEGQQENIQKKSTIVLEAPDGTTSNPLTKSRAEQMKNEAQSGNWNELNWNEYETRDVAIGLGKQVGCAVIQGAAIGVGVNVAQKLWNGEKIETDEIIENAVVNGVDFGSKAAVACSLKVGVEKDIIHMIPKNTSTNTITNIAFVAVENAKVLGQVATGELTAREGVEKLEQTTITSAAGIMSMEKGMLVGEAIGTILGPAGKIVGGFVGGTIGYMAGTKVGEAVAAGVKEVRNEAIQVAKIVKTGIENIAESVIDGVTNFCGGILNFFGI